MEQIDLIIEAQTILPLTQTQTVLENHAIAIDQGKIKAIAPTASLHAQYQAKEVVKRPHHALLPGFVNAHTHVPMNILRGLADDYPLMVWLQEHIFPAEGRFMNESFAYNGTLLAIAEMLRSGTTCFNDMYYFSENITTATLEAGMRACIGATILDFPTPYAKTPDDYFSRAEHLFSHFKQAHLISFAVAPHAIYTVSDENLKRCRALAQAYQLPISMHVQETQTEVEASVANTGQRPFRRLVDLGLVDDRFMAVHMTQINDEDVTLLQASHAHIVHCPQSNMKLASGICPITRLQEAGINVAIGTDSTASNNDLNMLEEMRTATLLAKVSTQSATAIPAYTALRMGTYHGAKALGLEKIIGSLEVGKAADLISIDLDQIEMLPLYHPHSQIIYASNRENVIDTWVNGRALMRNRELTTLDEEKLKATARAWAKKLTAAHV
ncbi:MAG: TRZ/ATZ family hydrolase [Gammaproteobacteria bacterium]|nr:TRZ/ATZ family hydrolase [Gammaproteobacteria bacterium]